MTEIEKMFENAGIEPIDYKLEPMRTLKFSVDDIGNTWTREQYMKEVPIYPSFTAEKQLKIIQLLSKIRGDIQLCYSGNQYIFVVNFETAKCQWANKYHDKLDEALADMVSVLWQSLTDQEKEEIRNILNENS